MSSKTATETDCHAVTFYGQSSLMSPLYNSICILNRRLVLAMIDIYEQKMLLIIILITLLTKY